VEIISAPLKNTAKNRFSQFFRVWGYKPGELAQFLHSQTQTTPLKIDFRQWDFGLELGDYFCPAPPSEIHHQK
jgi:hypothetical protein